MLNNARLLYRTSGRRRLLWLEEFGIYVVRLGKSYIVQSTIGIYGTSWSHRWSVHVRRRGYRISDWYKLGIIRDDHDDTPSNADALNSRTTISRIMGMIKVGPAASNSLK